MYVYIIVFSTVFFGLDFPLHIPGGGLLFPPGAAREAKGGTEVEAAGPGRQESQAQSGQPAVPTRAAVVMETMSPSASTPLSREGIYGSM